VIFGPARESEWIVGVDACRSGGLKFLGTNLAAEARLIPSW